MTLGPPSRRTGVCHEPAATASRACGLARGAYGPVPGPVVTATRAARRAYGVG